MVEYEAGGFGIVATVNFEIETRGLRSDCNWDNYCQSGFRNLSAACIANRKISGFSKKDNFFFNRIDLKFNTLFFSGGKSKI